MSDNGKLGGPKNLEQWFQVLPKFLDAQAKKKSVVSGVDFSSAPSPSQPKPDVKSDLKICIVCGKFHGGLFIVPKNSLDAVNKAAPGVCPECEKQLKAGHTALISPDGRSLMAKPGCGIMEDMRGKIVRLSNEQMDQLWSKIK